MGSTWETAVYMYVCVCVCVCTCMCEREPQGRHTATAYPHTLPNDAVTVRWSHISMRQKKGLARWLKAFIPVSCLNGQAVTASRHVRELH